MELYASQGFDATTVAEIAARAGLTERTFFRHFADKREVLFGGAGVLEGLLVRGTKEAPADLGPVSAITFALAEAAGEIFTGERRSFARHRQAIIAAHPDLRERELIKMASLTSALAGALRDRGVAEPGASLGAEAGVAVFKVSFERWVSGPGDRPLADFLRESLEGLKAATAG